MSSVTGLNSVIEAFNKLEKSIQDDIKDLVEETMLGIEYDAKANAPRAGDQLKTTYGSQENPNNLNQYITSVISPDGLSGTVQVDTGATKLIIYIEFGTGVSAAGYVPTLPDEFQEVAKKFYVNGKGTLIKHPFLLPAFFKHEKIFISKMKKILSDARLK